MKLLGLELRRAEQRSPESIKSSASAAELLAFFNMKSGGLPQVTIDTALKVPAFACGVDFLASSMASLPKHAFRHSDGKTVKAGGSLQRIINEAPNPEWSSFDFWKYLWTQRFTGGRGLAWIERSGSSIVGLWPIDPTKTTVKRIGFQKVYEFNDNGSKVYPASDVIDLPFLLKADQLATYSPITLGEKAIQLALAMNDYASGFFAGGGVPPLALEGPLPEGIEAFRRAMDDIHLAVKRAKESDRPFFGMPPGHTLKAVGLDPEKGQLTEARLFQVQEIARLLGLPPVFLQDLSHGTFANTEQQDLNLVKHKIAQLARQAEDELNLKLFGAAKNSRFVEHSLDGLMRGDFKSRTDALARAVQTALLTPNEARELDNRAPKPEGDRLYIQGATVPLGTQPVLTPPKDPADGSQGTNAQD